MPETDDFKRRCHVCSTPLTPVFVGDALAGWDCLKCKTGVRFES